MNSKPSYHLSLLPPPAGHMRRKSRLASDGVLVKWPSVDGWLPVADEAVRTAHASLCAAMALQQDLPGHPDLQDVARFLARRADMLLRFVDALATECRSENRLRGMKIEDVLEGVKQAEERLSNKVRALISAKGLKLQLVKLLEQECFLSQTSLAQIKLALLEEK